MIHAIITVIIIFILLLLGYVTQALRKFLGLITKWGLKLLEFFGIKILLHEKSIAISKEFSEVYKDIKIVKLSKKNIKQLSSIDWVNLVLFIIVAALIIINLNAVSGNAISNWIFSLIEPLGIVKQASDMNILYTAALFSVLSFALTKVITRWKDTKQQRIEKKQAILKLKASKVMTSKELLDYAKQKDEIKYKELKDGD